MTSSTENSEQISGKVDYVMPGAKILLMGGTGSGKTYSIRTLLDAGFDHVSVIFTEPGMEVLSDVPAEKLSWHYIKPAVVGWDTMISQAKKINTLSFKNLAALQDFDRGQYRQMIELYSCLTNFVDDRTGKQYGSVDDFPLTHALVIDSLSGLNLMAMNLLVGGKPVKDLPDWQVAQNLLENFLIKLTTDLQCFVVLIAHQEREVDEVTGGTSITVSTLGKKLAPKVSRNFSDCVLSVREAASFRWTTAASNTDLKTRNLPISDKLAPSFKPLVDTWVKRGGILRKP